MTRLETPDLQLLLDVLRPIGWHASDILLEMEHSDLKVQEHEDGPVTRADLAVSNYIMTSLQSALGNQDFAYLTEETFKQHPTHDRLSHPCVWMIDPLDGTKDFIQGTGEYAIHIALIHNHRPVVALVACPGAGTLYLARLGGGCLRETRDGTATLMQVSQRDRLEDFTVVVSRSHRNERFNQLMQQLPCQQQRAVGSIGGKLATIVEQQADLYVALSGSSAPKDWDLAAPDLILTEAGGRCTYFDGTPWQYNREDVHQWGGLLASNGIRHQELCTTASQILQKIDLVG